MLNSRTQYLLYLIHSKLYQFKKTLQNSKIGKA